MKTSIFDYPLPHELIAQDPLPERDASRLMVLDRATESISHHVFRELPVFLRPGDCLAVNTTRVLPARLHGKKEPTGGAVELLLLENVPPASDPGGAPSRTTRWKAMTRGASLRPGGKVSFADGRLTAVVIEGPEAGMVTVELSAPGGDVPGALDACGEVPLPPYITHDLQDTERYQTVYAERELSSAAPTAGLHFTAPLLREIAGRGVALAHLELAVGMDTFVPVREEDVADHRMHTEWFSLDDDCARAVNRSKARGGRTVAVGTTSVRALETCAAADGRISARQGCTDLFITPGYDFRAVDALITNFHFPRSTLLMLVCAFAGTEFVLEAYRQAASERYRFYSFGDAMLVL
jgi:S-adenosylmethionine:tRNA ribosyltransferase-isomerase